MNSVNLIGRLTRDPEIRYTGNDDNSAITTFSIAIDRPPKKDGTKGADFPRITVFGRNAVNCDRYLSKGKMVGVTGRIQTGSYTNKSGDKVYTTDIVADRVDFLGGDLRSEQSYESEGNSYRVPQENPAQVNYQPQAGMQTNAWEAIDDDDVPF